MKSDGELSAAWSDLTPPGDRACWKYGELWWLVSFAAAAAELVTVLVTAPAAIDLAVIRALEEEAVMSTLMIWFVAELWNLMQEEPADGEGTEGPRDGEGGSEDLRDGEGGSEDL